MSRKDKAVELFEKYIIRRPIAVVYSRLYDYTNTITKKRDCPFCDIEEERIIERGEMWNVICCDPKYPRHGTHYLIIPKRHIVKMTEITPEESIEMLKLMSKYCKMDSFILRRERPNGGSSVQHIHIHCISHVKSV